ncbi:M20 family metallopeptidase [Pseudalkalibacillus sp. A8]|uniref:M20 family metallopeptidase n=1 Tax=Pseudalkalibacillus sp. A8 TaxID=3382641 RepID=UPI0038B489B9
MFENWKHDIEKFYPKMVEIRRHLHQFPELSFKEEKTPRFIAEYLQKLGIEVRTGVGGRGVVGILRGGKPGKTIALRADFDALPINDQKNVPYKSKIPGAMYACGHDAHTAIVLGVATVLAKYKNELQGNIVFIHQFAEEQPPGGAKPMIVDGCLDGVDVIFGTHLQNMDPVGTVYYREGYIQAAADSFEIEVMGKGGHGALPHETIDPIIISSHIAINLQQIVSRRVNPLKSAVVSIGSIQSGEAYNVIPDHAKLIGTVRTFEAEIRDMIEQSFKKIIAGICSAHGANYKFSYKRGYDAVWNHKDETQFIKNRAAEVIGAENVRETQPIMPGEDFSYYLQNVPGTYFFTGAGNDSIKYPHHHPKFDIDEKAMLIAAKIFLNAIAKYNN